MPAGRPRLPASEKRRPVVFRFSPREMEALRQLADSEGRSMTDVLREALADYKKKVARKNAAAA